MGRMKLKLAILVVAILLPLTASAGNNVEVAGYFGKAFPGYSQSFLYNPGDVTIPIPGVSLTQAGAFQVDASGGFTAGGAVAFYFGGIIGIEGRFDSAPIDVKASGERYDVRLTLPGVVQPVSATLDLSQSTVEVGTLKPWSINLKIRTPGAVRFFASGGVSHMGPITYTVSQKIGLGATSLDASVPQLNVGTVVLNGALTPTEATSGQAASGNWGFNVGGGLQFKLGQSVFLVGEARYFFFKNQTFEWTAAPDRALSSFEQKLFDATLQHLEPVDFKPQFFQVTGGIAFSF
jgi:opacity protein-like surface antigen